MAIYGYTKNYKLIKPKYDTDTWHDYEYDNLDTIDAVLSAIYASGNWKGFWATNTAYVVGDVVIDRDTDTMYKVMFDHTTSEATFAAEWTAHPDYYELWSPNNLAESWATKTDGKVSNEDYSAKAYAISSGLISEGSAKEWAVKSGKIGNTNEYSAKKYATDAHNDYISMTTNENVVAVGSNINNVNAVGQSISNVNTVASDISSVNTVAGVSTDVTTVAGIASSVPTVANNDANITTVATNISDVNTAATNIEAIKNALTAATNAAQSATNAANSATDSANSAAASLVSAQQAASSAAGTHFKLFQHQWFDYELNDMAWLRADTFSWQSGAVYTNAYNHLVDDIDGITPSTETVGGQTVTFYRAADGHKIVLADQETTVNNIYVATGVAWYYILDTANNRFKLPRTKYYFNGLRDNVGDYIPESLPNIKGSWAGVYNSLGDSGAVYGQFSTTDSTLPESISVEGQGVYAKFNINASRSSSAYQDNAPVQQRGTQQYLYFYVGQYTQSAIEQTAGLNAELFNNKIDIDGNNVITAGANKILNTSSYTTNRILEIPQDIKLELNNGTLTLKAGSKVYALDGSSYTIPFDKTLDYYNSEPHSSFILVKENGEMDDIFTSESLSTISIGSKWVTFRETNYYLPICVATHNADGTNRNGWKSIDQVFNGFGYIGSTVFALPGVKVQAPNGKNEDGTYINYIEEITSVKTNTFTSESGSVDLYYDSDTQSIGAAYTGTYTYDSSTNSYVNKVTGLNVTTLINVANCICTSGKISSFKFANVDSVVNSNASNFSQAGRSYLSGLGMPSGRYIDLTLGASGSTYTAPANGWFTIFKHGTTGSICALENLSAGNISWIAQLSSETDCRVSCPAKSGDSIILHYNANGQLFYFRFVYAEGEN